MGFREGLLLSLNKAKLRCRSSSLNAELADTVVGNEILQSIRRILGRV